jgi:hypothetical protein
VYYNDSVLQLLSLFNSNLLLSPRRVKAIPRICLLGRFDCDSAVGSLLKVHENTQELPTSAKGS